MTSNKSTASSVPVSGRAAVAAPKKRGGEASASQAVTEPAVHRKKEVHAPKPMRSQTALDRVAAPPTMLCKTPVRRRHERSCPGTSTSKVTASTSASSTKSQLNSASPSRSFASTALSTPSPLAPRKSPPAAARSPHTMVNRRAASAPQRAAKACGASRSTGGASSSQSSFVPRPDANEGLRQVFHDISQDTDRRVGLGTAVQRTSSESADVNAYSEQRLLDSANLDDGKAEPRSPSPDDAQCKVDRRSVHAALEHSDSSRSGWSSPSQDSPTRSSLPSVPLIPESTRTSANEFGPEIASATSFNLVSSADRFAEAVVATLGCYDLDTPDDDRSADQLRPDGNTDVAASSAEKASDHSRWRDLLDDVANLSSQVERMLSQQEEVSHLKAEANAAHDAPSQEEKRDATFWSPPTITSGARPSLPYDPLKYCSPPVTTEAASSSEHVGPRDSMERSLLSQTKLREMQQQIIERRYRLDAWTADAFKDDAYL